MREEKNNEKNKEIEGLEELCENKKRMKMKMRIKMQNTKVQIIHKKYHP